MKGQKKKDHQWSRKHSTEYQRLNDFIKCQLGMTYTLIFNNIPSTVYVLH